MWALTRPCADHRGGRPLRPRSATPIPVQAHRPDAKMPQRRLTDLLRMVDARALGLDHVRRRNRHRIRGHAGRHDLHSGRHMDDPANRAIFRHFKICARVIACHPPPLIRGLSVCSGRLATPPRRRCQGRRGRASQPRSYSVFSGVPSWKGQEGRVRLSPVSIASRIEW